MRIENVEFFEWTDAVTMDDGYGGVVLESSHEIDLNEVQTAISSGNTVSITPSEGWFYWTCFAGCLPEGDPVGPFDTMDDAIDDATDNGYLPTYCIKRFYRTDKETEIIKEGLTILEAKEHCNDPETKGDDWFDGFDAE